MVGISLIPIKDDKELEMNHSDIIRLKEIYNKLNQISYMSGLYKEVWSMIETFSKILRDSNEKEYELTWKCLHICMQKLELYTIKNNENKSNGFEEALTIMKNLIKTLN